MVLKVLGTMIVILVIVLCVCRWSPRAAYQVLQHSQHLFEPDNEPLHAAVPQRSAKVVAGKRQYISPLVKKRVAANQKWRCASCKQLLDETYELDHLKPLFKGGSNDETNLQALCKRCHAMKSAMEQTIR